MYQEVKCKLCGDLLGKVHKKDMDRLFENHFILKHPEEWETLRLSRIDAQNAAKRFREIRANLGITMTVSF